MSRLAVRLGGWVCSERGSFGILKLMIVMTFVMSCLLWAVDLGFPNITASFTVNGSSACSRAMIIFRKSNWLLVKPCLQLILRLSFALMPCSTSRSRSMVFSVLLNVLHMLLGDVGAECGHFVIYLYIVDLARVVDHDRWHHAPFSFKLSTDGVFWEQPRDIRGVTNVRIVIGKGRANH